MKGFDRVFKTAGILLAGLLGGITLLSLVFLLPVSEAKKQASYDIIEKEGWYPSIPMISASFDTYFHSLMPGVLDGASDSLMLEEAMEPVESNVMRAALDMRSYDYYWHGYVTVLRPLLAVFDYGEIRVLNGMLQMLLVFELCLLLKRRKGTVYALLALSSYFLLMPLAMAFSLQFSWVFYITLGCLLYLVYETGKRELSGMRLYWSFLVTGMLTSFFDLLTYPLYTWGIPVIWLLLLWKEDKKQSYYVKQVVYTGLWWILGYAGMWIGKFCLASVILGRNIFEKAFNEVNFRLGMGEEPFGLSERLETLYVNWKHYEYKIYVGILALWFLYAVGSTLRRGVRGNVKNMALALTGVSSAVWYFCLANHTRGHHFFTYRIWGIAVLAVLVILVGSLGDKRMTDKKQRVKIFCTWGICGMLACGLSLCAREDIFVLNGGEYQQMELREGESCEMRFTPSFPVLKNFGLCLKTDAGRGVCSIILSDRDRELYREKIDLEEYGESTYAVIAVNWRLKRGEEYILRLAAEGADAKVDLLVTIDHEMPLAEYGEVYIGGIGQGAQILSGLTYSYRPLSYFTLFFLAMTWTCLLFAVCMTFVTVQSTPFAKAR